MDHRDSDNYLSKRDAAEYLGLSLRTVEYHLPEIPHYRVGRRIVFKLSELDAWMQQHKVPPLDLGRLVEDTLRALRKKEATE